MKHVRWTVIACVAAACGTTQGPADTVQFDPARPAGAVQTDAAVQAPVDASSGEFPPSPVGVDAGDPPVDGGVAPGDTAADAGATEDAGQPGAADAGRADAGDAGEADAGTDAGRVDAGPPPPPPPDDDDDDD
jgi:hypothetical protein